MNRGGGGTGARVFYSRSTACNLQAADWNGQTGRAHGPARSRTGDKGLSQCLSSQQSSQSAAGQLGQMLADLWIHFSSLPCDTGVQKPLTLPAVSYVVWQRGPRWLPSPFFNQEQMFSLWQTGSHSSLLVLEKPWSTLGETLGEPLVKNQRGRSLPAILMIFKDGSGGRLLFWMKVLLC